MTIEELAERLGSAYRGAEGRRVETLFAFCIKYADHLCDRQDRVRLLELAGLNLSLETHTRRAVQLADYVEMKPEYQECF